MARLRASKERAADLVLNKGLTQEQAAKLTGYSQQRISQLLQEVKTSPDIIGFKEHKADILEGLQGKIINNISDEDIKKASLQQKIISTSVLQDKIEQIRGVTQSMTDNQINILINNVINNYVANNTQPADIIDVQDIPPEIANNLNEL